MDSEKELPTEAIAALKRGSKIEAIKAIRVARGVGLKEAKEIVELHIDGNPALRAQLAAANARSAGGLMRWIVLLGSVAAIAWYFLNQG